MGRTPSWDGPYFAVKVGNSLAPICAALAGIALLLLDGSAVRAGSQTQPIDVTASINGACLLTTTLPSQITYDPISANVTSGSPATSLGTLTLNCNKNTTAIFAPDHGLYGTLNGTAYQPRMYQYANNDYLNYCIYQNAASTQVFGATTTDGVNIGTTESVTITANTPASVSIYMKVPGGQNVSYGIYRDQIDFTVTY